MSKQSSVEWLAQAIYDKMKMKGDGKVFQGILEQAKAMHQKETEEAYDDGWHDNNHEKYNPKQYYNETFNK